MVARKIRKFGRENYELVSNMFGTTLSKANDQRNEYKKKGYSVRVTWNGTKPWIYPEGRYYVYVRK